MKKSKPSQVTSQRHPDIARLQLLAADLKKATNLKDRQKIWWTYLGLVTEKQRVAELRALLRRKLPFTDDELSALIEATVFIQAGEGGLSGSDPSPALLKATERILAGRRPTGRLRKALVALRKNMVALNSPVQRLRKQITGLLQQ